MSRIVNAKGLSATGLKLFQNAKNREKRDKKQRSGSFSTCSYLSHKLTQSCKQVIHRLFLAKDLLTHYLVGLTFRNPICRGFKL